jgi:hypothetical protein
MRKTIFLVAAASLIVAGAMTTVAPAPAEAKAYCDSRADARYPYNKKKNKAYKKDCRGDYRAWKKRNDKGIWIIL